jgi:hypothetical protein
MGRLCLTIKVGESFSIGDSTVIIKEASGSRASVIVIADKSLDVKRECYGKRGSKRTVQLDSEGSGDVFQHEEIAEKVHARTNRENPLRFFTRRSACNDS